MNCFEPQTKGIHLSCCPRCNHADRSPGYYAEPMPGASAVCDTYHLDHIHDGEAWSQRHRHMFYGPHTHTEVPITTRPQTSSTA